MKRLIIVGLMAACVVLGWSGFVHAGTDLGQHCFQLAGGAATLRVSAVQGDGSELLVQTHARLRGTGIGGAFQLLGAGTFTQAHPPTSVWSMGLTFVNPSGAFSPNSMCVFHAGLDGSLNGSWLLDCIGLTDTPLSMTGTMVYVPCDAAM
jgi:hypothetical protein